MSNDKNSDFSILILAYARPITLEKIIEICIDSNAKEIFVVVDGPKNFEKIKTNQAEIFKILDHFKSKYKNLSVVKFTKNYGCSATLLASCDWVFSKVEKLIILEDDCVPTSDLFDFAEDTFEIIMNRADIWLGCGSQFYRSSVVIDKNQLSSYPLNWGWFTTREKWLYITEQIKLLSDQKIKIKHLKYGNFIERNFWESAVRRAVIGHTDVWDSLLLILMRARGAKSVLPPLSLITNVGDDEYAVNTTPKSSGLGTATGTYKFGAQLIENSNSLDKHLRKKHFRIRTRTIITSKVTRVLDYLKPPKYPPLLVRWRDAYQEFNNLL